MQQFRQYYLREGKNKTDEELSRELGMDVDTIASYRTLQQYREWKADQKRIKERLGFL